MTQPEREVTEDMVSRLGPRALAVVLRRIALPLVDWLNDGEYAPFVTAFAWRMDAAEPWYGLGHDPRESRSLELDAVEMRGSSAERQLWGTLWSASRAMESARTGDLAAARGQLMWTLQLVRNWEPVDQLGAAATELLDQVAANLNHIAETAGSAGDPPLDPDALEVPRFWKGETAKPLAGRPGVTQRPPRQTRARVFDEVAGEVIEAIQTGRVAVFFGAGVSIASGIPGAGELRRALLAKLPASEREARWLDSSELPFEAFLETLKQGADLGPFINVFKCGEPSPAHQLLAELADRDLVKMMATTNFDEHLERALRDRGVPCRSLWKGEDLAHPEIAAAPFLWKLHGTVSDAASIALTMEHVAGRRPVLGRSRIVRSLFGDGPHETVLILGYSCSDHFDVTPHIEALGGDMKRVYLVDHTPQVARAEDIWQKPGRNPFGECPEGVRLLCDTDVFLARLAKAVGIGNLRFANERPAGKWRESVDDWWDAVPTWKKERVGHEILGGLCYRCGDHRAAKTHFRAALAAAGQRAGADTRSAILLRISGCHRALSEYSLAQQRIREATRLVGRNPSANSGAADVDCAMGNTLFNTGRVAEAIECYERSVETLRGNGGDILRLGTSLANLGNAYGASERLEEALACFEEALEIARDYGDKMAEGSRLGGIGQVYRKRGLLADAEDAHRKSLEAAESMDDPVGTAMQLGSLALVHSEQGRLDEAIAEGQTACAMFEALGDHQGVARVLGNLAADFIQKGLMEPAIRCEVQALTIAAAIGEGTVFRNSHSVLSRFIDAATAMGAPAERADRARSSLRNVEPGNANVSGELEAALLALLPFCADPRE